MTTHSAYLKGWALRYEPNCDCDSCTLYRLECERPDVEPRPGRTAADVDWEMRKLTPITSGVLAYFPDALAIVARVSQAGNDQHNPGEPLHWAREKSTDEADALVRHLIDYLKGDNFDGDGQPHLGKVAWRALALLQRWVEGEEPGRG